MKDAFIKKPRYGGAEINIFKDDFDFDFKDLIFYFFKITLT